MFRRALSRQLAGAYSGMRWGGLRVREGRSRGRGLRPGWMILLGLALALTHAAAAAAPSGSKLPPIASFHNAIDQDFPAELVGFVLIGCFAGLSVGFLAVWFVSRRRRETDRAADEARKRPQADQTRGLLTPWPTRLTVRRAAVAYRLRTDAPGGRVFAHDASGAVEVIGDDREHPAPATTPGCGNPLSANRRQPVNAAPAGSADESFEHPGATQTSSRSNRGHPESDTALMRAVPPVTRESEPLNPSRSSARGEGGTG